MAKDRAPLIIGNWKMNMTQIESLEFIEDLLLKIEGVDFSRVTAVIAPPYTCLSHMHALLKDTPIELAGQDCHTHESGPFTGEIAAKMLAEVCSYVIIGHSERRAMGENNDLIRAKIRAALSAGISPVLCIGETAEQRELGTTLNILENQLQACLAGFSAEDVHKIIIAYEPVWAISKGDGKGKTATVQDAESAHVFIRSTLDKMHGKGFGKGVVVIYGGSVNPENIQPFVENQEIDGVLPGGASLDPQKYSAMIKICEKT